jgi:photosystem II stability/assembly factor-like uncharacterized protein
MFESKVLLATTDRGLARAGRDADGDWSVASLLEGEPVRCLARVPSSPGTVYAGTHGHGILRSEDRGRTWQPAGMAGQIVKSLAASAHDPGVLYAGTKPAGVFVTRDGGASWTELEAFRRIRGYRLWRTPSEPPDWRAYVSNIAISPTESQERGYS